MNPETEHKPRERKRLNLAFLALFFGFLAATHEAERWFEPLQQVQPERPRVRLDPFLDAHPFLGTLALVAGSIAFIAAVTKLFLIFWNRFVSDVFRIREISLVESLALQMAVGGGLILI